MSAPSEHRPAIAYGACVLVAVLWGGAFAAGKIAVHAAGPFTVATLRFAIASVLLLVILARREGLAKQRKPGVLRHSIILGLLGVFGYNAFLFAGLRLSSATNGALLAGANPIATAMLAALILRERLSRVQMVGTLLSFLGVIVVVSGGSLLSLKELKLNAGDALLLGSLGCFALNSIFVKKALAVMTPLAITTLSCTLGTFLLAPFMVNELSSGLPPNLGVTFWISIGYLAVLASVVAYVVWYFALGQLGPSRASIFTNLVPVFGTLIAVATGERLALEQLGGGALVVLGVLITTRGSRRGVVAKPALATASKEGGSS